MRQGCANLCEGLGSTPQNDAPRSGVCRVYGGSGGNVADCGEAGLSVAAATVGQKGLVGESGGLTCQNRNYSTKTAAVCKFGIWKTGKIFVSLF